MKLSFALIALSFGQDDSSYYTSTSVPATERPDRPQWYPYGSVSVFISRFLPYLTPNLTFSMKNKLIFNSRKPKNEQLKPPPKPLTSLDEPMKLPATPPRCKLTRKLWLLTTPKWPSNKNNEKLLL